MADDLGQTLDLSQERPAETASSKRSPLAGGRSAQAGDRPLLIGNHRFDNRRTAAGEEKSRPGIVVHGTVPIAGASLVDIGHTAAAQSF